MKGGGDRLNHDKIRGALFGVAIGDALGATVEFMTRKEIKAAYGMHMEIIGGGFHRLEKGEITDDTAMTLAVAKGIIAAREEPIPAIGNEFVAWYQSKPKSMGNTIRLSIEQFIELGDWKQAAKKTAEKLNGRTAGNGSLMRTLPISLAYNDQYQQMDKVAVEVSNMTHWNRETALSCLFYNRFAAALLVVNEKEKAYSIALEQVTPLFIDEAGIKIMELLNQMDRLDFYEMKASGYVIDTLITSIKAFLTFDSFERILIEVVNLGNDADTVGAVAGGLAGSFYGFQHIPARWIKALKVKEEIEEIAEGLQSIDS